jgi:hypothetical protein
MAILFGKKRAASDDRYVGAVFERRTLTSSVGRGARALSPDTRYGPPDLRSFEAACAPPSMAPPTNPPLADRCPSYAGSRGKGNPSRKFEWGFHQRSMNRHAALRPWQSCRGLHSAFDEGLGFFEAREADEVVPDHLFHCPVRLLADVDQDQHVDDHAAVRLDLYAIAVVREQVPTAKQLLERAEEHLDQPAIAARSRSAPTFRSRDSSGRIFRRHFRPCTS